MGNFSLVIMYDGPEIINVKFLKYAKKIDLVYPKLFYRDNEFFIYGGYYYNRALDFEYRVESDLTNKLVFTLTKTCMNISELPGYKNLISDN